MIDIETDQWIDKTPWGEGPWQDEPDRVEWRVAGLPCLMVRNPHMGFWCGYVGVPPDHLAHGVDWDSLPDTVQTAGHGGVNFANPCAEDDRPHRERVCHTPRPGESDAVWWFGFDCGHSMDWSPGLIMPGETSPPRRPYRSVAYVMARCTALAIKLETER